MLIMARHTSHMSMSAPELIQPRRAHSDGEMTCTEGPQGTAGTWRGGPSATQCQTLELARGKANTGAGGASSRCWWHAASVLPRVGLRY